MIRIFFLPLLIFTALVFKGNAVEIEEVNVISVTETSVFFDIKLSDPSADKPEIVVKFNGTSEKTHTYVTLKQGDKFEVRDLKPGGGYEFSFRISSSELWTDPLEVVLLPSVPQVIFRRFTGGRLMIQIYRMLGDVSRVNIDKYRVSYNEIKLEKGNFWVPDSNVTSVDVLISDFGRFEISGLANNTYYEVRVEAHTDAGFGKPYRHKFLVDIPCC